MGHARPTLPGGIAFYRYGNASNRVKDHGDPSDAFYTFVSYTLDLGASSPIFSGPVVTHLELDLL
jgi:hypothetical protein